MRSLRRRITKTMEEMIKRLEAEKVAIEAANTALQVTADAAKADAAKAEAARVAAEEAAAAGGSSSGGGVRRLWPKPSPRPSRSPSSEAQRRVYATRGITYPEWPAFDSSVKFNETDPTYVDGHVRALAWRKVWQAIKEHFEAARDEYAHSLYNAIMKVRLSPLEQGRG